MAKEGLDCEHFHEPCSSLIRPKNFPYSLITAFLYAATFSQLQEGKNTIIFDGVAGKSVDGKSLRCFVVCTFNDPVFWLKHRHEALTFRFSFDALVQLAERHLIVSHQAVQLCSDIAPSDILKFETFSSGVEKSSKVLCAL